MKPAFIVVSILIIYSAGLCGISSAFGQDKHIHLVLHSIKDSVVTLPNDFIIPQSLHLSIDEIALEQGKDFIIDSFFQAITLSLPLRKTFFSVPSGDTSKPPPRNLELEYSILPLKLHHIYSRYVIRNDSNIVSRNDTIINSSSQSNIPNGDKAMNLTKSGGITRGIQAGSTQDLSFTNSFNLTFSGDLGDELSFKGAVSEESTPLQPEGNTQILRDIDRIYLEMNVGKSFQATLGDYTLDLHPKKIFRFRQDEELEPVFNNFSRKVLGAKTWLEVGPTQVILSASATKGKFFTYTFQGIDAVQGPYRLQGKDGEQDIIVIAGTEHVYIDGVELIRGELNDYVIDYGLSEIRFTNKRIITSNSRITVDFEYTDEQYSRTLIAGSQMTQFFGNKIQISTSYIREGDNQNSPLNLTLSDSDKTILTNAGADPTKANKSGVSFAGKDSLGRARGNYSRIDSLIGGKQVLFYRYSPFDTVNAIYNIGFGYSGTNKGAYTRNGIGEFTFVGLGLGDYDTTVYLPLPQLNQIFTGQLTLLPLQSLALTGEFALSQHQPNLFAPLSSVNDHAYRLYGSYLDTIGSFKIGSQYKERFTGAQYTPIDRDRKVEELREYGIDQPIDNYSYALSSERERSAAVTCGITPADLTFQYGLYSRGIDIYRAERLNGTLTIHEDSLFVPNVLLSAGHISTSDSSIMTNSIWDNYSLFINKSLKSGSTLITPSIGFNSEKRSSHYFLANDTLSPESFSFEQWAPGIDIKLNDKIKFGGLVQLQSDDSSRNGILTHISDGTTYQFSSTLTNLSGFSSQIDIGYRKKDYSDSVSKLQNGGNVASLLLRLLPHYQSTNNLINIDGIYEASEQRAARLERVFFPVQKGVGNYKYLGDLNGNGKQDPEEFAPATYSDEGAYILLTIPTEALYPVTDLRSSLRIRISPFSFLGTETSIRIEENSSDPNSSDIYLYRLSHFLNDTATLHGLIEMQQDINILDNNPAQSYRLRFLERKNATQYNTGLEQLYYRELSMRARFHLSYEISNETNAAFILDNARSNDHSTNLPHATKRIDAGTEWTYEPFASAFGFGLKAAYSAANDNSFFPIISAAINSLSVNSRYNISGSTRLRAELERDEVEISNSISAITLPYSLTQGKSPGSTWLWSLSVDLQIASGIVLTASYNGRSELADGINRSVIHNARAEVRASF